MKTKRRISLIPVQSDSDEPIYGGSGRPYITATFYTADGRLLTIGRNWRDPEAIAGIALEQGAVGEVKVHLSRHGKRGLVETHRWIAADAALTATQIKAAHAAALAARIERGNATLRRAAALSESEGRADDAAEFRRMMGTRLAIAYADDPLPTSEDLRGAS